MADEELLKQDENEQGKPKVVANDSKWTSQTEIRRNKHASTMINKYPVKEQSGKLLASRSFWIKRLHVINRSYSFFRGRVFSTMIFTLFKVWDLNISKLIMIAALHFAYLARVNKEEDNE